MIVHVRKEKCSFEYESKKKYNETCRPCNVNLRMYEELILILNQALCSLDISLNHLFHESIEGDLALPSKDAFRFGRVTKEKTD